MAVKTINGQYKPEYRRAYQREWQKEFYKKNPDRYLENKEKCLLRKKELRIENNKKIEKIEHETSRPLTKKEYEDIIAYCRYSFHKNKNPLSVFPCIRNIAIFSIMWYIGTRPLECYGALLSDVDLQNNTFKISADRNKTRKDRTRKIPAPLIPVLKEYLHWKNRLYPKNPYLFPSSINEKEHLSKRALQESFQRILKRLNLLKVSYIDAKGTERYSINLYSFRKGHGTYLYEKTGDPYLVQKSLDHLHPETTMQYYIKSLPQKMNEKIENVWLQNDETEQEKVKTKDDVLSQVLVQMQQNNQMMMQMMSKLLNEKEGKKDVQVSLL